MENVLSTNMPETDTKPYTYVEANSVIKWFIRTEKPYSLIPVHLMIFVTLLSLIAIFNL